MGLKIMTLKLTSILLIDCLFSLKVNVNMPSLEAWTQDASAAATGHKTRHFLNKEGMWYNDKMLNYV